MASPPRFLTALLLALITGFAAAPLLQGQPKYPPVNTATVYVYDPTWPQHPGEFQWGAVPGVAVDARDQVYVFTRAQPPVRVYDAKGKLLRTWGQDTIKEAHHIKIGPDGNVWISDIGNHVVQEYTPEGKLLRTLGTVGKAGRDKTHLNKPTDMAVTPAGDVFVSDGYGNARVVHFDKEGRYVHEWGELGQQPGQFSIPHAIALDGRGRLYVADRNNVRVQVFDQKGKFLEEWRNLIVPWGFWLTKDDMLWVCGSSPMQWRPTDSALGCPPKDQIFMKFTPEGKVVQLFTLPKGLDGLERPGEVNWVHCIATDSAGNLYLGDIIGRKVQKFLLRQP